MQVYLTHIHFHSCAFNLINTDHTSCTHLHTLPLLHSTLLFYVHHFSPHLLQSPHLVPNLGRLLLACVSSALLFSSSVYIPGSVTIGCCLVFTHSRFSVFLQELYNTNQPYFIIKFEMVHCTPTRGRGYSVYCNTHVLTRRSICTCMVNCILNGIHGWILRIFCTNSE